MTAPVFSQPTVFESKAYGKVNVHLGVGEAHADGYHELASVFQAVDVCDHVTLIDTGETTEAVDDVVASLRAEGIYKAGVPEDASNLAWKAVLAVARRIEELHGPQVWPRVELVLDKGIPAAGGMAGGSADAAAALRVADACLCAYAGFDTLGDEELYALAADLGSDVPFTLMGGTALGTGRGEQLTPMLSRGTYTWAFITHSQGLSTPAVFKKLDEMRAAHFESAAHGEAAAGRGAGELADAVRPHLDTAAVAQALVSGDVFNLGVVLANDLQPAAVALHDDIATTLRVGEEAGAVAGIVSGSGPTCAFLCEDRDHAEQVVAHVLAEAGTLAGTKRGAGRAGFVAAGPAPGATIVRIS